MAHIPRRHNYGVLEHPGVKTLNIYKNRLLFFSTPATPLSFSFGFFIYFAILDLPPCHQDIQHLHFVQACPVLILSLCVCIVGSFIFYGFGKQLYLRYNSHTIYPFKEYS